MLSRKSFVERLLHSWMSSAHASAIYRACSTIKLPSVSDHHKIRAFGWGLIHWFDLGFEIYDCESVSSRMHVFDIEGLEISNSSLLIPPVSKVLYYWDFTLFSYFLLIALSNLFTFAFSCFWIIIILRVLLYVTNFQNYSSDSFVTFSLL